MNLAVVACVGAGWLAVAGAHGQGPERQPQDATPPATTAQQPADGPSVLRGPAVKPADAEPSLVDVDFNGHVKRPDTMPEAAALRLLSLDDGARAAAEDVIAEHTRIFDQIVIENLDVLMAIGTANSAGDKRQVLSLLHTLYQKSEPLRAKGLLRDRVAAALPEAERAEFLKLVDGYFGAVVRQKQAEDRAAGRKVEPRFAIVLRERAELLGEEAARSFQRQVGREGDDFERILASLDLRPEQETRIRRLIDEFVARTKLNPTEKQEQGLFLAILAYLDPPQREKLLSYAAKGMRK